MLTKILKGDYFTTDIFNITQKQQRIAVTRVFGCGREAEALKCVPPKVVTWV